MIECVCAELIKMGGNYAKINNERNITIQFIKNSYMLVDEMKILLQDYVSPVDNPSQQVFVVEVHITNLID